jgi:hypothetical protein
LNLQYSAYFSRFSIFMLRQIFYALFFHVL